MFHLAIIEKRAQKAAQDARDAKRNRERNAREAELAPHRERWHAQLRGTIRDMRQRGELAGLIDAIDRVLINDLRDRNGFWTNVTTLLSQRDGDDRP